MKKIIILFNMVFMAFTQLCAQHAIIKEEKLHETALELAFKKNADFDIATVDCYNDKQLRETKPLSIESKFSFDAYFKENKTQLLAYNNVNRLISDIDTVVTENYKIKNTITMISVLPCRSTGETNLPENLFLLRLKEMKYYMYNDEITSLVTTYHYYWYCELFTTYITHYSQSILHTPEMTIISYEEATLKNNLSILEKKYANVKYQGIDVFPNPIMQDNINVAYFNNEECATVFALTDLTGKLIKEFRIKSTKGLNIHSVDIGKNPKGIYILKGTINAMPVSEKLVIQ